MMTSDTRDNRSALVTVTFCMALACLVAAGRFFLPANVAAVGALAILVGGRLRPALAYPLPFLIMAVSDALLYVLQNKQPYFLSVYLCYLLYVAIGQMVCRSRSWWRPPTAALLGTSVFFLLTNLEAWWRWYDHNPAGLGLAYAAGLPFIRPTALSDLGFTIGFFALLNVVLQLSARMTARAEPAVSAAQ
jgi:hypothetical protein